jgi:hypothetical protein
MMKLGTFYTPVNAQIRLLKAVLSIANCPYQFGADVSKATQTVAKCPLIKCLNVAALYIKCNLLVFYF